MQYVQGDASINVFVTNFAILYAGEYFYRLLMDVFCSSGFIFRMY